MGTLLLVIGMVLVGQGVSTVKPSRGWAESPSCYQLTFDVPAGRATAALPFSWPATTV